jgi:hypothetical protein
MLGRLKTGHQDSHLLSTRGRNPRIVSTESATNQYFSHHQGATQVLLCLCLERLRLELIRYKVIRGLLQGSQGRRNPTSSHSTPPLVRCSYQERQLEVFIRLILSPHMVFV